MPLWYTLPNTITSPLQIDGLIGWYNSNSAEFGANNFLIRWNDLSSCKNDLVPYNSNIRNDFLFNNTVLTNESPLNLDKISSGATVFIVGDLNNTFNTFNTSFYVSLFTNIFENNTQIDDLRIITKSNILQVGSSQLRGAGVRNNGIALVNAICFNSNYNNGTHTYSAAGYINNSNVTKSISPLNITTDSANKFNVFIGDNSNATRLDNGINAQIFEILLYNKVLVENDINFINNYLATKHAIILNNNFVY